MGFLDLGMIHHRDHVPGHALGSVGSRRLLTLAKLREQGGRIHWTLRVEMCRTSHIAWFQLQNAIAMPK